jgi:PAS domain S-box-containing protein
VSPISSLLSPGTTVELRERLELALTASRTGVWEWDIKAKKLFWSPECFTIMGMHEFDGSLNTFMGHVYPDDQAQIIERAKSAVECRGEYQTEFRILRSNGKLAWIANHGRARFDESGRATHLVGIVQDITEKKNAISALQDSQLRLSALVDSAMDAVVTIDENQRIVLFNATAERIFGYTQQQMMGQTLDMLLPARFRTGHAAHIRAFSQTGVTTRRMGSLGTVSGMHADGHEFPLEASISQLRVAGQMYFTAILRDISERKKAEENIRESESRFRQLAENIQDVFYLYDCQTNRVVYLSPAYEKIWGRPCSHVYDNVQAWMDAVHPEDAERVRASEAELHSGKPFQIDYRIVRPDGVIRSIRDRAYPVQDADGHFRRVAGVAKDLTENFEMEERLRRAQKLEAVGQLAGGIAHDFNNILGGLLGYTELSMLSPELNQRTRDYLDHVLKGIHRARDLIRQILAFSRGRESALKPLQLQPLAKEVLKLLRATIPATISIEERIELSCPRVMGDPAQVHQLLMNLCTNAYQAMESGKGVLSVELYVLDRERLQKRQPPVDLDSAVCLCVRDNGIGMTPETQRRVYEPFFTTKPEGKGTGLGLSIVQRIVAQMNGEIRMKSEYMKGTEFELIFPCAPSNTNSISVSTMRLPLGSRKARILLVDDEVTLVQLGAEILGSMGHEVTAFSSSIKALTAVTADPFAFDLLITDLAMPNLSGYQLIDEIRKLNPSIPVILASGNAEFEAGQHADVRVECILNKPVSVAEYGEAVDRCLKGGSQ